LGTVIRVLNKVKGRGAGTAGAGGQFTQSSFYSPQKFRRPDRFNPERPVQIQEVFVAGHDSIAVLATAENSCNLAIKKEID
jgi:hypothetical protein